MADTVRQSGLPVEYTLVEGYGHTLVVGARLREAVSWLLAHRR